MIDLINACETESELDFLQESFVLTDEQKETVLQQGIIIWTNAIADNIARARKCLRRPYGQDGKYTARDCLR